MLFMNMDVGKKWDIISHFIDLIFTVWIGCLYIQAWVAPLHSSKQIITELIILLAFELLLAHSGTMLAIFSKTKVIFVLIPFYVLFGWAMHALLENYIILILYFILIVSRTRYAFIHVSKREFDDLLDHSLTLFLFYFGTIITVILMHTAGLVPKFGLTASALMEIGYETTATGINVFVDHPETSLCIGAIYYLYLTVEISISILRSSKNIIRQR